MNRLVTALKALDVELVEKLIREPRWASWSEPDGKNAIHYLCGVVPKNSDQADTSLKILKLLLKRGIDLNSIHRIEDSKCNVFPATPLWYAYTRGRNETIYKHLLKQGADPSHCWWAIAWYDDVKAGELWLKHGATIDEKPTLDELFLGSFGRKITLRNGSRTKAPM